MARQQSKQVNFGALYGAATGTDTYAVTITGFPARLSAGLFCLVKIANASTGAATLNVNGLGAVAIRVKGSAVSANDLDANGVYLFVYDGTYWHALNGALA